MRAIEISEPGGAEVLTLTDRETPVPTSNEVLIKVCAAGVNRPDVLQRMGAYPAPPGASDLPGLEVSGEVISIGKDVKNLRIGDQVCALLAGGGYAEFAVADAGSCLPVPSAISIETAAGLPETYFTVYANVFDDAALKSGETLLVHGATSGIGVTAIALGKAFGARVIATASSDAKCQHALNCGADVSYRYDEDAWDTEIIASGGTDVVLDMAGGDFFKRNISTLNQGGRHVSIAMLRGAEASFNIFHIMRKRIRISGSTMKSRDMAEKARLARALKADVWPLIEDGTIKPQIDRIFPLEEASEAHKLMESGGHMGKILLKT